MGLHSNPSPKNKKDSNLENESDPNLYAKSVILGFLKSYIKIYFKD